MKSLREEELFEQPLWKKMVMNISKAAGAGPTGFGHFYFWNYGFGSLLINDMRILHVIPNLSGGGAERQLSYLAPELVRMGHEVHIAYSKKVHVNPNFPVLCCIRLNHDPITIPVCFGKWFDLFDESSRTSFIPGFCKWIFWVGLQQDS